MASNAAKNTYNGKLARHEKEDNLRENIGKPLTNKSENTNTHKASNAGKPHTSKKNSRSKR